MKACLRKYFRPTPTYWIRGVGGIVRPLTGEDLMTFGGVVEPSTKDANGKPLRWLDPHGFLWWTIPIGSLFWFGYVPNTPVDAYLTGVNKNDGTTEGVHFLQQVTTGVIRGRVRRGGSYTADLSLGAPAPGSMVGLCISWGDGMVSVYRNGVKKAEVAGASPNDFNRWEFGAWTSTDTPRFSGAMHSTMIFFWKATDFQAENLTRNPARFL